MNGEYTELNINSLSSQDKYILPKQPTVFWKKYEISFTHDNAKSTKFDESNQLNVHEILIRRKFRELVTQWRKETAHLSLTHQIATNRNYQMIIAMGPTVIPLVLRELQRRTDHWFWALEYLCETDPVKPKDRGDIDAMRNAWLNWGRSHGYL